MPHNKVYSFRAECPADVARLLELMTGDGLTHRVVQAPPPGSIGGSDVAVEVHTSATFLQMQGLLRQVVDGHVMVQTLRPVALADNSLERDYDAV
jgi:hypothetical protein